MDTIVIDKEDALNGLRAAVATKGADYVYESPPLNDGLYMCLYVQEIDGELHPRCIIGYALHHLGVPLQVLAAADNNNENVRELAHRLRDHGYQLTDDAIEVLQAAQIEQDSAMGHNFGSPEKANWGAALAAAEKVAADSKRGK